MKIIAALCLALSLPVLAEPIPGEELLKFFGSTCSTGDATRSALSDSQSLISTLEKLSSDVDCQSAAGSIGSLQQLQQQLRSINNLTGTQADIAELDSKEQQLLIHLSQTTDPQVQAETNAYLRDLQIERAGVMGRSSAQADLLNPNKGQLAINAIYSAQSLYSQLTADTKCMAKHPSVLNQATSIVSAVGAGVAMINPAIGFGLSVGANFVGATVEGVRKIGISRDIRKLSDETIVIQGVKCALETMSDRYCLSLDTEKFINFKTDSNIRNFNNKPAGRALLLTDRQLPIFLEWLKQIRSGVKPTTTAEASRQSLAIKREAYLRAIEVESIGLINNSQETYNSYASQPEKQWVFIRSIIKKLAPGEEYSGYSGSSSSSTSNPLYDIKASGYGPFFLLGLSENADRIRNNGSFISIDSWERPPGYKITLKEVKERYQEWVMEATQLVERERNLVQQPDAQTLLHKAYNRTAARFNISPLESLKDIIDFIELHPPSGDNLSFKKLYASTLDKLRLIRLTTENSILLDLPDTTEPEDGTSTPEVRAEDPLQASVKKIYRAAQLDYGTIVIETRIEMILSLSLYDMLETLPSEDRALVAQFLAANRFSDNLKRGTSQSDSLIMDDIRWAKGHMHKNLESFTEIFQKNINRLLVKLAQREKSSDATGAAAVRYQRAHLCHLLLAVPQVSEYVDVSQCEGLTLDPTLRGGPTTTPIRRSDFEENFESRACTRREFFRQSLIYEKWKIR